MHQYPGVRLMALILVGCSLNACGMEPSGGKRTTPRTSVSGDAVGDASKDPKPATADECQTPAPELALQAADAPTYEGQIKAIIGPKCAWCHSATANAADRRRPYLTSYETVRGEATGLIEEMQKGEMPPSGEMPALDAGDTAILQAWQAAGFPRGTSQPPVDPAKGVYYVTAIQQLLATNCVGCHKTAMQPPNLDNYDDAAAAAAPSLAAIKGGTMPPSGPMTTDETAAFQAWVDGGTLYDETGAVPPESPVPAADPACL